MIYALEWYDVPRSSYFNLVEFHPYLTEEDYDTLYYIKMQHYIENTVSMGLFTLITNRFLFNRGPSYMKIRTARYPFALLISGLMTYSVN